MDILDFEFLNEAEFKRENIAKVMQLYRKLFGKYFGGDFKIFAEESYKKPSEKGSGIRLINDLNYQLRFNWAFKESNNLKQQTQKDKTKLYISSIDYWEPTNTDFEKPSTTVNFLMNVNVVQIWQGLAKVIKKGIRGKYTLNDLKVEPSVLQESNDIQTYGIPLSEDIIENSKSKLNLKFSKFLNEAKSPFQTSNQRKDFLKSMGMNSDMKFAEYQRLLDDDPEFASKAKEYAVEIGIGKKETNSTSEKLKALDKELDDTPYSDPELVFQDIEDMTELVAKGKCKSLIVCGMAGVGKTFHITKVLKQLLGSQPGKWFYHSGMKASAVSFYIKTFEERNGIIVWDEADSLLKNDDIVMMLKPALDTSGDNTMEYSRGKSMTGLSREEIEAYGREVDAAVANGKIVGPVPTKGDYVQVPGKFYFNGSMIFISNMPAKSIESAVLSRSIFIDVKLCASDVNKRIMSIMHKKYSNYSDDQLEQFAEALGGFATSNEKVVYMTPEYARKNKPVTIRSMELAIQMKEAGLKNWARLASLYA